MAVPDRGRAEPVEKGRQVRPGVCDQRAGLEFGDRHRGADGDAGLVLCDAAQRRQPVQPQPRPVRGPGVGVAEAVVGLPGESGRPVLPGGRRRLQGKRTQATRGLGDDLREQPKPRRLVEGARPLLEVAGESVAGAADARVAGAAAQVAGERVRGGVAAQQRAGEGDDQARGAVAALDPAGLDQCLLDRGEQLAVQPFDGDQVTVGDPSRGE